MLRQAQQPNPERSRGVHWLRYARQRIINNSTLINRRSDVRVGRRNPMRVRLIVILTNYLKEGEGGG